jgi:hypothetical protein
MSQGKVAAMPPSVRFLSQHTLENPGTHGRAAMLIWPRLNPGAHSEPLLIADNVGHRTSQSTDVVVAMLEQSICVAGEPSFYFG